MTLARTISDPTYVSLGMATVTLANQRATLSGRTLPVIVMLTDIRRGDTTRSAIETASVAV